jgi:dipeptidyl aminopeptidase/acylaminoacyl peptidase
MALMTTPLSAQPTYKRPPQQVVDILDAPPTPIPVVSPARNSMLLVEFEPNPSIALLAQPFLRLAGVRINPKIGARQRTTQFTGITIQNLDGPAHHRVELPADARTGMPAWSHDGKRIAFARDLVDGVELWVVDAATGRGRAIPSLRLNDILGTPFEWTSDNRHLLVRAVPRGRGPAPEAPEAPIGPNIEETAGRVAKAWTYQDLLRSPHDEDLFQHYATGQLALVDADTGDVSPIGAPGLISGADFSPDEHYLLVTTLKRPFSYRVPFPFFARSIQVWDANGKLVRAVADLPIADDVPPQGVPKGAREARWQALRPATLLWVEALDEGDPTKKVPHRDKLLSLATPFEGDPREALKLKHRFSGIDWLPEPDRVLLTEYDRDRRWRTTHMLDLRDPETSRTVLFDLSAQDAYGDPGDPVHQTRPDGQRTVLQDGDSIYLAGDGASELGDHPFLDRLDLKTRKNERLFHSAESNFERFLSFVKDSRSTILTRHEAKTEPPNFVVVGLPDDHRTRLTDFRDPAPQLTGLQKELIKYKRADGVPLSGTLYLPPDYKPGTRLPLVVWAYPLEYSDASTAGQVRGSPHTFTRLAGDSPLFFVTQGYAVLYNATMPVVGDPETMNDTFLEQIAAAAKAAIETLDAKEVIDPRRVCVAGHSYGAFMTANLLAHTDLFAAGIARSGAYNRTLTPFGFQGERRSFWEATDLYTKMSPFTFANKVKTPLLLIHGEADNNPGTHTIQSERFYQAIKGNGGTARLVLLPHESHGYRARESVLHVLAEMFEWADRHVKHRSESGPASPAKAAAGEAQPAPGASR